MCSVFGLIDYQGVLNHHKKNHLLNTLAHICEARGTGIAYHEQKHLCIYKRPLPAHRVKFRIPPEVRVVLGHTRMTTQGNDKFNQNNHPFRGKLPGQAFALAHNGVPWNDHELRHTKNLPRTSIQTDSYVAVQLLEKQKALDFASLKTMAEKVEDSFVFTVLDAEDSIWFVRRNNPLAIFRYDGFLLYASTSLLLTTAEKKLCLEHLEEIRTEGGDIFKIDRFGQTSFGHFAAGHPYFQMPWSDSNHWSDTVWDDVPFDDLFETGKFFGVTSEQIQMLLGALIEVVIEIAEKNKSGRSK